MFCYLIVLYDILSQSRHAAELRHLARKKVSRDPARLRAIINMIIILSNIVYYHDDDDDDYYYYYYYCYCYY